jgi:hypothetical protein
VGSAVTREALSQVVCQGDAVNALRVWDLALFLSRFEVENGYPSPSSYEEVFSLGIYNKVIPTGIAFEFYRLGQVVICRRGPQCGGQRRKQKTKFVKSK